MPSKPKATTIASTTNKNLTSKQQRREAKKAEKKAEKKQLQASHVIHPVLGRNTHKVFCGGMKIGPHWPFEVPLSFPDLSGGAAAAGLTVPCGWSNLNTHAMINRACLVDPETGELKVEIVGPPVAVNSHFGSSLSPGTVSLRVTCPDLKEPIEMVFVVTEGAAVKEGMVGNEALVALNVRDIHKYKMESYMPALHSSRTPSDEKEKQGKLDQVLEEEENKETEK